MSYCRFSSDNWKCQIYAYESCDGGYQIHVASSKPIGNVPKTDLQLIRDGKHDEYLKQHKKQMDFLDKCKHGKIGLPFDGDNINCETLQEFKEKMIELREAGYSFPDYVLEDIDYEIEIEN